MFKNLFFLAMCVSLPILGNCHESPQNENLQIGRYNMVGVPTSAGGIQLYLLDTATGLVWKSTTKNYWLEHDAWEPQILTPPESR